MTVRRKKNKSNQPNSKEPLHPVHNLEVDKWMKHIHLYAPPVLLLVFGIFIAILYFGHQQVPNSDFPAFVKTGQQILHFQKPDSFKRLPGLGVLQILMSHFAGGSAPILTGGLLLNAVLYPLCGLLVYGIGKRYLGSHAFWVAVIALINPWVLLWMRHPIVELPLIFFILLTFYLLFHLKNPRWAYLAAFCSSMIRYEGALLIPIIFVWDILRYADRKQFKQWIISFCLAAAVSAPVGFWVLGQFHSMQKGQRGAGYIGGYKSAATSGKHVYGKYYQNLWQMSIGCLTETSSKNTPGQAPSITTPLIIEKTGKWALGALCLMALGWAIRKKRWDVVAMLFFTCVYYLLHAYRPATRPRYAVPILWLVLLISVYGLTGFWQLLTAAWKPPRISLRIAQILLGIVGIIWAMTLIEPTRIFSVYSPASKALPFVAIGIGFLYAVIEVVSSRGKQTTVAIASFGILCMFSLSNQFHVVQQVGNGALDAEFRVLANWYIDNAKPGELMATTMSNVITIFAPKHQQYFRHTSTLKADTPEGFIQKCYQKKITYIAWDSRLGFNPNKSSYKRSGLKNIAFLGPRTGANNKMVAPPKKIGPFERVKTIQNDYYRNRFIFVYKLHPLPPIQPAVDTQG